MDSSELTRKTSSNQRLIAPMVFFSKWIGIVICLLLVGLLGTQLRAQNTIQFSHGGDRQLKYGDTVEIPLIAQNLENLQSIQFNLHFNPHIIEFLDLKDLDTTSGIFPSNIGLTEAEEGRIFFVSVASGTPIELADGDTLCVLSFEAIGLPGSTTLFGVQGYPLELQAFDGSAFVPFESSSNFVSINQPDQAGYTFSVCPNIDSSGTYDIELTFFGDTIPYDFSLIQTPNSDTLFQDTISSGRKVILPNVTTGNYLTLLSSTIDSMVQEDTLIVSEAESLLPTFITNAASCPQIADGGIELPFIEGGNPPYTVIWPDSTLHFRSFDQLVPDIYEVTIIDQGKCSYLFDVEVEGPEAIVQETIEPASCETAEDGSIISNVLNLDRFEDSTLLFSLNASDWFRTEFLQVISLPAGTFTYYIQDTSGCIYTQNAIISFDNTIQLENVNQVDPRCFGTNDGLVSATARLDIVRPGDFIFDWSGPNPSTTDSFFLAVGLSPDSFILEVTHTSLPASCFDRQSIVLEDTDSLILSLDFNSESCLGLNDGLISVTPEGGRKPYTFEWADGSTDSLRAGLSPGTYSVEVNDANFCSQFAEIIIDTGFLLSWENITTTDLDCPGQDKGQIAFSIDTQYRSNVDLSYILLQNSSDSIILENLGDSIFNLEGGNYDLSVLSLEGCRLDTILNLEEPGPIIIDSFEIISGDCNRSNAKIELSLQGGNGQPFSYTWSNGSRGSSLDSVLNGDFGVTVSDSKDCIDSFSFNIPDPPPPVIDSIHIIEPVCFGDSTALIALRFDTAAAYNFLWNTGSTGPTIERLSAGLYTVTVSSNRNCTDTLEIEIEQPDPIQISFETEPETSGLSDGSARALVTGGTEPYSYFWNTSPIQTEAFAQNLSAGIYEVLVIDSNNCRGSDTVRISMTTSVDQAVENKELILWPNPATDRFHLENKKKGEQKPISIEIRDQLGRLFLSKDWPEGQTKLEVEAPGSGLYYVHVLYINGEQKVIPVIVQQ